MNKQIGYITSAHLILFSIAAGYFFISKISSTPGGINDVSLDNATKTEALVLSPTAAKGKTIFAGRCANCHAIIKKIVLGPPLAGFESRGPWSDRNELYKWIRDPVTYMKNDPYTAQLKKKFEPAIMGASPSLTDQEIDAIVEYITAVEKTQPASIQ